MSIAGTSSIHRLEDGAFIMHLHELAPNLWAVHGPRKPRNRFGTEITHWRTGSGGMT